MKIKIIGANCKAGIKLRKNINKVILDDDRDISIELIDNCFTKYPIRLLPAMMIDGQMISEGKVLTIKELRKVLI